MTPETEVILHIADTLGIAVEYIFGIFVQAQMIMGILGIIFTLITITLIILFCKYIYKIGKNHNPPDRLFLTFMSGIAFIIALVIIAHIIAPFIMMILCPEYMAMQEIISLIK